MRRLILPLTAIVAGVCIVAAPAGASVVATAPEAHNLLPSERFASLESRANIGSLDTQVLKDSDHVVLTIHATLVMTNHCSLPAIMVTARVNGVDLDPPFPAFVDDDNSASGCSATGTFRIDLDAAEYVHPGVFLDQPLHVELTYAG